MVYLAWIVVNSEDFDANADCEDTIFTCLMIHTNNVSDME